MASGIAPASTASQSPGMPGASLNPMSAFADLAKMFMEGKSASPGSQESQGQADPLKMVVNMFTGGALGGLGGGKT